MNRTEMLRDTIRANCLADENRILEILLREAAITAEARHAARSNAVSLIRTIRESSTPELMEIFIAEYGLSSEEGIALMCLAEALLRVPDPDTIDALINDKIAPSEWGKHLGQSSSSLVNASTWALMLTGKVLKGTEEPGITSVLRGLVKRLGEPVIRTVAERAVKILGAQFVLGETIGKALSRSEAKKREGFTYSYDMLGEAALTAHDAQKFFDAYSHAIDALAATAKSDNIAENPGISIKLSALHPRYELTQAHRAVPELVERTLLLASKAKAARIGFNIDAEEAARLDISLDIVERVLRDPSLAGWDGFGVVVQAYGKRAGAMLDWLYALSSELDRRIMVRLVKGAYWDTEIKLAQVEGISDFPVFTRKAATDVAYLCCAAKLLGMRDRIYPQFATHNAHSVAMILQMAGPDRETYEFQRLHGMGEALHDLVRDQEGTRCRIYAPVGAHRDLLAYLVRRLLENGANSSFVNQIVNEDVPPEEIAADPFELVAEQKASRNKAIRLPANLFGESRRNSRGWDLQNPDDLDEITAARAPYKEHKWNAGPAIAGDADGGETINVINPANPEDFVGSITLASAADVGKALANASDWSSANAEERAAILLKASDLYEANFGEFFALFCREAGKTPDDAIAELREAVDFLRYYANEGVRLGSQPPRGVFTCISPWNFPLAIFTGQIAAALGAGNGVLAKPAEATTLTAHLGIRLMHEAGVPRNVLQFLPGHGRDIGAKLTGDPRIHGVCFTGSTQTAQLINKSMAGSVEPHAPLIAETGGLNAMIVDSTALAEQAIRDILDSAFRSAGQRCSALRMLYLQTDIEADFLRMLFGAMDKLIVGDPWPHYTDVGPVIDRAAQKKINAHIDAADAGGRLLKRLAVPEEGSFVGPSVIRLGGIGDLKEEIFGPVLHVASFDAGEIGNVVEAINASGYGLTFGMHTRIDGRVQNVVRRLKVGNIYVNRNQIGAIVGSQPFGGEGLSGTGPKAGGPNYVPRFQRPERVVQQVTNGAASVDHADPDAVQSALDRLADQWKAQRSQPPLETLTMPGPTGESNQLSLYGRGVVLCLGATSEAAGYQARIAKINGCFAIQVAPGAYGENAIDAFLDRDHLATLAGFALVALWSDEADLRAARLALAERNAPIVPLCSEQDLAARCWVERHICIDTTAAGGNATLLSAAE
jgi:RHH-type proline utilization regulon transcriptional repressor/proline dehydrogenase/delta 1-pyrroline-5-carboxylate dehydrogenase